MRICASCRQLLASDVRVCPADGAPGELFATLPIGARLGGYRIERQLGEGGMGFVYEAVHEQLHRRGAIKTLRPELAAMPQIVTRFLNEARAANLINHQNIVNVYDYGDTGCVYLVMEFLEGETLEKLLRRYRPLPLPLALHIFGQLGRALAAAHARQIVHRDLKPDNVFIVAREGNPYFVKLLDFGIAQLRGAGAIPGLTVAGQVMGTPQYMSPEQITGGDVDARSDVWAMGVMLYRAVTGQPPFSGAEFGVLADRILHHAPPLVTELVEAPPVLAQLIAGCLERRAEARCPSIAALLADLESVKRACGLDDDAITAAIAIDTNAPTWAGSRHGERTGNQLGDSLPIWQGAQGDQATRAPGVAAPAARPRTSRHGPLALAAAVTVGLGCTVYGVLGRDKPSPPVVITPHPPAPPLSPPPVIDPWHRLAQALTAGDLGQARSIADQLLRAAIASDAHADRSSAVDALARVPTPAMAPLLYAALDSEPDAQSTAARALADLGLPDAAARLRAVLASAGTRIKVELAAAMYRLKDPAGRQILRRALSDAGLRLTAAEAMAAVGDDAGRAALAEILQVPPTGSGDTWLRAAASLARLGDDHARAQLAGELAQPNEARSVGAAELLALAGDSAARDRLAQDAADPNFARRGSAALALARLGDRRALDWVAEGAHSLDAEDRKAALAICGRFPTGATTHLAALAIDPDRGVSMSAAAAVLGLGQ